MIEKENFAPISSAKDKFPPENAKMFNETMVYAHKTA